MNHTTFTYYPCGERPIERLICGVRRDDRGGWYCSLDPNHPTEPHIAYENHCRPQDADHCDECRQLVQANVLETWGIPEVITIDELPV